MSFEQDIFIKNANALMDAMGLPEGEFPRLNKDGVCYGLSVCLKEMSLEEFCKYVSLSNSLTSEEIAGLGNRAKQQKISLSEKEIIEFILKVEEKAKEQRQPHKNMENELLIVGNNSDWLGKIFSECLSTNKCPNDFLLQAPSHAMEIKRLSKNDFAFYDPNDTDGPQVLKSKQLIDKMVEKMLFYQGLADNTAVCVLEIKKTVKNELKKEADDSATKDKEITTDEEKLKLPESLAIEPGIQLAELSFNNFYELIYDACKYGKKDVINYITKHFPPRDLSADVIAAAKPNKLDQLIRLMLVENKEGASLLFNIYKKYNLFAAGSLLYLAEKSKPDDFLMLYSYLKFNEDLIIELLSKSFKDKNNVLCWTIINKLDRVVEVLINDANMKVLDALLSMRNNPVNPTVLHVAAKEDYSKLFTYLAKRYDVKEVLDLVSNLLKNEDEKGKTPVLLAFELSGLDFIIGIINILNKTKNESKSDPLSYINAVRDKAGNTVYHAAVLNHNLKVLDYLLNNKLEAISKKNTDGKDFIEFAAQKKASLALDCIIDWFLDGRLPFKITFMELLKCAVIGKAHSGSIKSLIAFDKGSIKKIQDYDADLDKTFLHYAAKNGDIDTVKLLLEILPPDGNLDFNNSGTPLQIAIENDHYGIAELLIKEGADVNNKDGSNRTPLTEAIIKDNPNYLDLLLKNTSHPLEASTLCEAIKVALQNYEFANILFLAEQSGLNWPPIEVMQKLLTPEIINIFDLIYTNIETRLSTELIWDKEQNIDQESLNALTINSIQDIDFIIEYLEKILHSKTLLTQLLKIDEGIYLENSLNFGLLQNMLIEKREQLLNSQQDAKNTKQQHEPEDSSDDESQDFNSKDKDSHSANKDSKSDPTPSTEKKSNNSSDGGATTKQKEQDAEQPCMANYMSMNNIWQQRIQKISSTPVELIDILKHFIKGDDFASCLELIEDLQKNKQLDCLKGEAFFKVIGLLVNIKQSALEHAEKNQIQAMLNLLIEAKSPVFLAQYNEVLMKTLQQNHWEIPAALKESQVSWIAQVFTELKANKIINCIELVQANCKSHTVENLSSRDWYLLITRLAYASVPDKQDKILIQQGINALAEAKAGQISGEESKKLGEFLKAQGYELSVDLTQVASNKDKPNPSILLNTV